MIPWDEMSDELKAVVKWISVERDRCKGRCGLSVAGYREALDSLIHEVKRIAWGDGGYAPEPFDVEGRSAAICRALAMRVPDLALSPGGNYALYQPCAECESKTWVHCWCGRLLCLPCHDKARGVTR